MIIRKGERVEGQRDKKVYKFDTMIFFQKFLLVFLVTLIIIYGSAIRLHVVFSLKDYIEIIYIVYKLT